jgi:hypothetical protein
VRELRQALSAGWRIRGPPWSGAASEHHGVGCDRTRQGAPRAQGDSGQDPPNSHQAISSAWPNGRRQLGIPPVAPILHGAWVERLRSRRRAFTRECMTNWLAWGSAGWRIRGLPWSGAASEHHGVGCDRTRQGAPRAHVTNDRPRPHSIAPVGKRRFEKGEF